MKYNSAGDSVWKAVYVGSDDKNDQPYSIAVDNSGDVYVTGGNSVSNGSSDYITIKYNSSGVQQWAARYNGQGNSEDIARSISVDSSGNVFVTGGSGSSLFLDYVTVKYNTSGIQQWAARYNGPGDGYDAAVSISSDGSGNVYVTGGSDGGFGVSTDYATIKYNSDGIQQWAARYNGTGNGTDFASSICIDGSENIYVTGGSDGGTGSLYDYATIKYNSSGEQQWAARYNGPENLIDIASSIFVDDNGNVYVTGSDSGGVNSSFTTIKYNSSGEPEWVKIYNNAAGNSIAVDSSGNAYVTGVSRVKETDYDYLTIKYNSDGIQQWDEIYNGPGNSTDIANSIALDASGNVYVTGGSAGIGTNFDFATIKYSQSVGITQVTTSVPAAITLSQNYPNPFNPITNLEFGISDLGFVSLKVYDILGKEVITLVNEKLSPGKYKVEFDGSGLTSGVYFYRLNAGEFTDTKRMMLVK
ncbi:MAG: SBBP repeat-containing protein [Ignavibacteria bacterium]|nr:SBBP repeat-containing protein [Ignavibacteria bacterium]